jgi:hypothetical protein
MMRFKIHLLSSDPICIRHALVRLANKTARTDARGRATIVARFGRTGRRRVRASKPGCMIGATYIRVARR